MDPVSSRGSQSPSTTVESELSPAGLVPQTGSARTPANASPNASPATANKLQSYQATGGEARETMCKQPPPPFSRAENAGEEAKLLEQLRHRQAAASAGRGVELCKAPVDVDVARDLGLKHHWLRTSSKEAGMGPNDGSVPGEQPAATPLYGPTRLNDHTGRGERAGSVCQQVTSVDEACVNRELEQLGKQLGNWTPANNCQTYSADVLEKCSTKERAPRPQPLFDPGKI